MISFHLEYTCFAEEEQITPAVFPQRSFLHAALQFRQSHAARIGRGMLLSIGSKNPTSLRTDGILIIIAILPAYSFYPEAFPNLMVSTGLCPPDHSFNSESFSNLKV